jgi:clan AA aspartic protease
MAFIKGRVNDVPEPVVTLQLVGGVAGDIEVECVVDTGFTGALVLPRAVVDQLGLPIVTHEEFRMVGGMCDSADIALAQVHWLGEVRRVDVIVKEAYLVGAALLAGARLTVDYAVGTVLIEQT